MSGSSCAERLPMRATSLGFPYTSGFCSCSCRSAYSLASARSYSIILKSISCVEIDHPPSLKLRRAGRVDLKTMSVRGTTNSRSLRIHRPRLHRNLSFHGRELRALHPFREFILRHFLPQTQPFDNGTAVLVHGHIHKETMVVARLLDL